MYYIHPGSPKTKLCPLVGSGILYMDHPKDHSLFGLGPPGYISIYLYRYIFIYTLPETNCLPTKIPHRNPGKYHLSMVGPFSWAFMLVSGRVYRYIIYTFQGAPLFAPWLYPDPPPTPKRLVPGLGGEVRKVFSYT